MVLIITFLLPVPVPVPLQVVDREIPTRRVAATTLNSYRRRRRRSRRIKKQIATPSLLSHSTLCPSSELFLKVYNSLFRVKFPVGWRLVHVPTDHLYAMELKGDPNLVMYDVSQGEDCVRVQVPCLFSFAMMFGLREESVP
jgi:hypothetical protein